jgi:cytochrome c oxidase subunit 2
MGLLPENVSTYGSQIDRLFWIILSITGVFFFLVQGCLLLFVLRYRARPGVKASYVHGNNLVEVVWTIVPALILLALTVASERVWAEIRFPRQYPKTALQVEVLAEQFAWNIRYPGEDGLWDTADDITTINQLHLPVGEPVLVTLRSKDVIHSLFIPQLRVKHDTVPGLMSQIWLEASKAGSFEILCAELCGLGHYRMRGFATTESPEAFRAWLAQVKANGQ